MSNWQPAASNNMLLARARLNRQIRAFFEQRNVLEVETPLLARSIGTDPALDPITANYQAWPHAKQECLYLQTSPEFAMKRLLAANSGAIYQLGKAFRNGEVGRRHNPEFTMLEWYRPGFTLEQLMDEVAALVNEVLGVQSCQRRTYAEIFTSALQINPHSATLDTLQQVTLQHIDLSQSKPDRTTCLELLYSHLIEPQLQEAVLIYDYPAEQAALAKVATNAQGQPVARRFELVIKGMEIANGYDELLDAAEQQARYEADKRVRTQRSLPAVNEDKLLLAALQSGLPACAGVALGVDRLLMLQSSSSDINTVLAFPYERI